MKPRIYTDRGRFKFPSKPLKKGYSIIYADPPWPYRDNGKNRRGVAEHNYPVMTYDELHRLRVNDLAAKNCALFLWTTMPQIPEALRLMRRWDFEYITVAFTWVKMNRKNGRPFMGMGYYTRANAELCLLGKRGKIKPKCRSVRQLMFSPVASHSQKPNEARRRIVRLLGVDKPRIELFAREKARGWDAYGDEVKL